MKCSDAYSNLQEAQFLSMYHKWTKESTNNVKNLVSIKELILFLFFDFGEDLEEANDVMQNKNTSKYLGKSVFDTKCYIQEGLFKTIEKVKEVLVEKVEAKVRIKQYEALIKQLIFLHKENFAHTDLHDRNIMIQFKDSSQVTLDGKEEEDDFEEENSKGEIDFEEESPKFVEKKEDIDWNTDFTMKIIDFDRIKNLDGTFELEQDLVEYYLDDFKCLFKNFLEIETRGELTYSENLDYIRVFLAEQELIEPEKDD